MEAMNMNQNNSSGHGGARPGAGRPRGSKSRRTEDVEAMLERLGCNPLEVLAMIAINDKEGLGEEQDISITLRQRAASDLMCYVAPKLRSTQVELSGSTEDARLVIQASPGLAAKFQEAGVDIDWQTSDGKSVDHDTFNGISEAENQ